MSDDLYNRYKRDLSEDTSDIDYSVAFIKSFRTLKREFIKNTIWEDLWLESHLLDDLTLAKKIVELSNSLSKDNSLYGKYTDGVAYAEER